MCGLFSSKGLGAKEASGMYSRRTVSVSAWKMDVIVEYPSVGEGRSFVEGSIMVIVETI